MPKQNSSILFNRYIWLINLISSAGSISREEINSRWSRSSLNDEHETAIPERTFHRYRIAIEEMFQINIAYSKARGYFIENSDSISRDKMRQWMLNTFSIKNLLTESIALRDRILLEDIPSGQEYLSPIIEAMRDGLRLRITYQSYTHAEPSTFTIAPYCIKIFKQRWYVLAESEYQDKQLRVYSLDRVKNMQPTDIHYSIPDDFHADEFFAHNYGVSGCGDTPELIEVVVDNYQANYLRSLKWHPSQDEVAHNDDYSVFHFFVVPSFEFIQLIKGLGAAAEVTAPKWLREQLKYEYETLNNKYNEPQK